jgi:hypothetical protein
MKQTIAVSLATAATALWLSAAASAGVGVSVNIGEPGFYGQLDLGDIPQPELINPRPVIIEHGVRGGEPLYLHVPAAHQRNWRKYCGRYDACGRPVYFVQDRWYREVYVPRYHQREEMRRGGHDEHHDDGHDNDHHDDHHDDRDHH